MGQLWNRTVDRYEVYLSRKCKEAVKGLILAIVFTVAYVGVITVAFNARVISSRAALMTRIFLLSLPMFVVTYIATPPDLGVLPAFLAEPLWVVDITFGVFVYSAAFFGGVLQLYNLADRGFSLRIMIDIDESTTGKLDSVGVMSSYGGGQGIKWMYDKRIQNMIEQGVIAVDGDRVTLTERGRRAARLLRVLRTTLRLEECS